MPRFRVLQGLHSEGGKVYGPKSAAQGLEDKSLYAGEIVETDKDLERLNCPGVPPKFERLDDEPLPETAAVRKGKRAAATV